MIFLPLQYRSLLIHPYCRVSSQGKNMVSVTKDFQQSKPNGISSDSVKADVLGFFSLVISYAKAATEITSPPRYENGSPKNKLSMMPRTEFVTLYAQLKGTLPGSDSLYNLIKVLACYRYYEDEIECVEIEPCSSSS